MILIGDSNMSMWAKAYDVIGKRIGWRVIVLSKNNCGPAALHYYQYQLKREFVECDKWQTWRMSIIRQMKPSVVVMAGYVGGNLGPGEKLTNDVWSNGLLATFKEMPAGTKLVTIGNQPHQPANPDECIASHSSDLSACNQPTAEAVTHYNDAFKTAASKAGGVYVDPTPWLCATVCPVIVSNNIVYSGRYHITNTYGVYLSGVMQNAIKPVTTG